MLELQEVAGRVEQHEGAVLPRHGLKPCREIQEERDLAKDRAFMQSLEIRRLTERDTEVPRVETRRFLPGGPGIGEVADQLISEEIQRYPVRIAAGEHAHVEVLSLVEVVHGNGQVKNIAG